MSNKIKHSGVIESVTDEHITVRIVQSSACSSCKVASYCNSAEQKVKKVDVYGAFAKGKHRVGDEITVVVSLESGMKAVVMGFGLPFIILVCMLFFMSRLGFSEPVAALSSIGMLTPYYILLYFMRDKISRKFSFDIE